MAIEENSSSENDPEHVETTDQVNASSKGDHINVLSHPYLMKIMNKQGDQLVLFADKVLKFTEYDLLMASTRKNEILYAVKTASDYELDVVSSNRFEFNAASDLVKEIEFEEVEGGVKTRILRK
ncbi:hypothetical protein Lalb_Chr23g0271431 [Lupinus albus]|uniref:Uncharacterized protein n=1 Tax=Lupinus albus TaxID=3870 RepID=A0A6A4NL02_LUPAL|nr:hypothetical protein Lalb_Chr23g0271431 [Lupinus albus]